MAHRTLYVVFCLLLALSAAALVAALGGLPETAGGAEAANRTSLAWQIETVDSDGNVGLYTSLALDAAGRTSATLGGKRRPQVRPL